MTRKRSKFYTDAQGRVRYMGNDQKKKAPIDDSGVVSAPRRSDEKGSFITNDEGRVIFVGGPGSGGGGVGASVDINSPGWGETSIFEKITNEGDFTQAIDEYQTRKYGSANTNMTDTERQRYMNARALNMVDDAIELFVIVKQQM